MESTTRGFTRQDVADYLRPTFEELGIVERDDALSALRERGAPAEMIQAVAAALPEGTRLQELRSLWEYLRDIPMARSA